MATTNVNDHNLHSFEEVDAISKISVRLVKLWEAGAFSPVGLSTDFRVTTLDVSTTAIPLPATAFTDRNAISILNQDSTSTLYIGKATVTADSVVGTTSGWEIGPNEIWHVDIKDTIVLYGIVASGTIKVKIIEVA